MSPRQTLDACIFGAGPGGIATGARLIERGATIAILDRPLRPHAWVGETLSGEIRAPLTALGMWTTFCVAGHVPGYEFRSIWGSPEPSASEAIFRPYGHNWHVDRARFDDDLRQALTAPGGIIRRYGKLVDVRQTGDAWDIVVDDGKILHARFLVDATGRSRALGRRLGATRRHFDQLVALVARVPRNQDPAYDNAIVVEARPDGWWYAAPVPDGHVIAYLTDRDLVSARLLRSSFRVVAANSALTDTGRQSRWLPVGDAFAAHDPLCGWGVSRAMSNGIRAAEAILAFLDTGDAVPIERYRQHCVDEFGDYLQGLVAHYAIEQRWQSAEFWARRKRGFRLTTKGERHGQSHQGQDHSSDRHHTIG